MIPRSKTVAAALLLGFATANLFAIACVWTGPMAMAGSMADCDMEMPESDGVALGATPDPCCLTCVVEAGLLDDGGLQAPFGVAVLPPLVSGVLDVVAVSDQPRAPSALPGTSPPVFLLTGSLLI